MKININDFRRNKPYVLKTYKEKGIKGVGFLCSMTGIPHLAAFCYIDEEFDDPEVKEKIKDLTKFYKYDTIEGREEKE